MGAVCTRKADLDVDRGTIVSFLHKHLTLESNQKRFEWLYLSCPAGRARARIATDSELGNTVGVAAAFPRQIRLGSNLVTGWVLGDFCIAPTYRSGWPALMLQQALIEDLCHSKAALYYDFPSAGMMAIYRRLRVQEFGQSTRFVQHLGTKPLVRRVLWHPFLFTPIAGLLDFAVNRVSARSLVHVPFEMRILDHSFSEEFSDLDDQLGTPYQARIARNAAYLNWRFRAQPERSYTVMTARQNRRLIGFLVFTINGEEATIEDLTALDQDSAQGLIRSATNYMRISTTAKTVHFPLLAGSPLVETAVKAGFRARESTPVIITTTSKKALPIIFTQPSNWILTKGDRDS